MTQRAVSTGHNGTVLGRQAKPSVHAPTGRRLCCLIAAARYSFRSNNSKFWKTKSVGLTIFLANALAESI
jgi:hypothetical protein